MTQIATRTLPAKVDRRDIPTKGRRSGRGARKKAARSSARQPLELRSVADDLAGDWNAEHNLLDPEFDAFDGDVLGQLGVRLFDDAY